MCRTYHRVTDADALLLDMKSLAKLHFPDIEIGSDLGGFQDLLDFNSMTVEDAMLRVSYPETIKHEEKKSRLLNSHIVIYSVEPYFL